MKNSIYLIILITLFSCSTGTENQKNQKENSNSLEAILKTVEPLKYPVSINVESYKDHNLSELKGSENLLPKDLKTSSKMFYALNTLVTEFKDTFVVYMSHYEEGDEIGFEEDRIFMVQYQEGKPLDEIIDLAMINDYQYQEAYINSDLEISTITRTESEGNGVQFTIRQMVENGFKIVQKEENEYDPYQTYPDGKKYWEMAENYLNDVKSELKSTGNYPK